MTKTDTTLNPNERPRPEKEKKGEKLSLQAQSFFDKFQQLTHSRIDFERLFEAERRLCLSDLRPDGYIHDMTPQEKEALRFLFENL